MLGSLIRKVTPERWRPIGYLTHQSFHGSRGQVRSGPFKGMKYIRRSCGSCYIPKILGIYERELYPLIEEAVTAKYDLIIDIGAAEGYYAVGMAMRCPDARVIGYELEPRGQAMLKEMTQLNGQEHHVEIRAKCEPQMLQLDLASAQRPLVICDCEGYEEVLLDPEKLPDLKKAAVLVELHDFIVAGVTQKLMQRFGETHTIREIIQTDRSPADYPYRSLYTRMLPRRYLDWAVSEWRPVRMSWLLMTPKNA
jgi:hypothetical protein